MLPAARLGWAGSSTGPQFTIPPYPSFGLDCGGLVETFQPDVTFQFSLGAPLIKRFFAAWGIRADDGRVRPAAMTLLGLAPVPSKWPTGTGIATGEKVSRDLSIADALVAVADALQSPGGAAVFTLGSMMFSQNWTVKLCIWGGAMYGVLYFYEWMCYTRAAKIRRLKTQFSAHLTAELRALAW